LFIPSFKHDNRFYRVREGDLFGALKFFTKQGVSDPSNCPFDSSGSNVRACVGLVRCAGVPVTNRNREEFKKSLDGFGFDVGKRRPLVRTDAADMLKRRLKEAGLPAHYSPHSFRATGITNFLENDGTLEAAQRIAGHADSRTTKLYDRRGQKVLLEDMERIRY
jgi:hypothetical protein